MIRTKVWRHGTPFSKSVTSFLIELLYLLTLRERVRQDENQDAYHALVTEIETIISSYNKTARRRIKPD